MRLSITRGFLTLIIMGYAITSPDGLSTPILSNKSTNLTSIETEKEQTRSYDYPYTEHLKIHASRKYDTLRAMVSDQLSAAELSRLGEILEARELTVNGRNQPKDQDSLIRNRKKFDEKIRVELGDNIADTVIRYLKESPTRSMLARLNLSLIYKGKPLNNNQIDAVCRIFLEHPAQTSRNLKSSNEIRSYLRERVVRDNAIIMETQKYLSPLQVTALSAEMQFQLSYTKVGIARAFIRQSQTE